MRTARASFSLKVSATSVTRPWLLRTLATTTFSRFLYCGSVTTLTVLVAGSYWRFLSGAPSFQKSGLGLSAARPMSACDTRFFSPRVMMRSRCMATLATMSTTLRVDPVRLLTSRPLMLKPWPVPMPCCTPSPSSSRISGT